MRLKSYHSTNKSNSTKWLDNLPLPLVDPLLDADLEPLALNPPLLEVPPRDDEPPPLTNSLGLDPPLLPPLSVLYPSWCPPLLLLLPYEPLPAASSL